MFKVSVKEVITNIKSKAKTTGLSTRNLISQAVETLPTSVSRQLPNMVLIYKIIRRIRTIEQNPPTNPININNLVISGEYTVTSKGDKFLFYDSKMQKRVLIFSTLKI